MKSLIGNTRRADVTFRRNGKIDLSSSVARSLSLEPGDGINILTDGDEYYLYVAHRSSDSNGLRYEARCFATSRKSNHFRSSSVRLCRAVLKACNQAEIANLAVGPLVEHTDGRKMLTLITRLNITQ